VFIAKAQKYITLSPEHVWASSIFLEKKMDGAKGNQGKKEASNPFVLLPAITPTYMQHLMWRVMGSTYEYYQIFHIDNLWEN